MITVLLLSLLAQSSPQLVTADQPLVPGAYSRLGLAAILGAGVNPVKGAATLHGRVGLRVGLLDRNFNGFGPNVALAVLVGGTAFSGATQLGVDLRVELLYVGNKVQALQPLANVYFTTGLLLPSDGRSAMGFHLGGGLGFDLIFAGMLGNTGVDLWAAIGAGRGLGMILGAAALLITAPTVECRYTMRTDGTGFGSVVVGIGI
jgi:hypothetical protein